MVVKTSVSDYCSCHYSIGPFLAISNRVCKFLSAVPFWCGE